MKKNIPATQQSFPVTEPDSLKLKVLNWAKQFSTFCFLDNQGYRLPHQSVECIMAAGTKSRYRALANGSALAGFQHFLHNHQGWLFGHFGYELKAETEGITKYNITKSGFADIDFFEPEVIVRLSAATAVIEAENPALIWQAITGISEGQSNYTPANIALQCNFTKDEYVETIQKLKGHILRGDCYEINFCINFFTNNFKGDPITVYQRLSSFSPNPFSALYKMDDQWLLCASPERYLRKEGDRVLSQPIKGTAARVHANQFMDAESREQLFASAKDRSENVMVVDLVRNDLSKVCEQGSVKVDELFGIYTFPQVHQMISTISGELKKDMLFTDLLRATFPMGSMTGAPKKRVIELIDQFEKEGRGIFSGAVGYLSPKNHQEEGGAAFDFNVVIRSIIYNEASGYLSLPAGSGITFYSQPESEWEECLLKATAMKKALGFE